MASNRPDNLQVEIVTAERELYSGEADYVSAPGIEGRLGILPKHAAMLALLGPGALRIRRGGQEEPIFVSGGFLEVSDNRMTILADNAEHADEIDEARAQEARRRAEESLAQSQSNEERADLQAALARAISRIHVAELARRSGRVRLNMPTENEQ